MKANTSVRWLNMAWNGISSKLAAKWLRNYVKASEILEFLDMSNNRLQGPNLRMMRMGILKSTSLQTVKLGGNIFKPEDAQFFLKVFTMNAATPLKEMNLEDVFIAKDAVPVKPILRY